MNDYWCVYVIETDKHLVQNWDKVSVYVGMSKYSPKERFLQHQNDINSYLKRHGKPLRLVEEFTVEGINNEKVANDIERLIWFNLSNSDDYQPVQKYAPSLQGRTDYPDNYPNYGD